MSIKSIIPFVLGILTIVLLGLILVTLVLTNKPKVEEKKGEPLISQPVNTSSPFPTQIIDEKSVSTSPTRIPPGENTGVLEEELPKETRDLAVQKMELRAKMPLALSEFSIDFNYETDRFTVLLIGDKETSESVFTSWLSTNYPAIPIDRFTIE